jgi:hypothetical protein
MCPLPQRLVGQDRSCLIDRLNAARPGPAEQPQSGRLARDARPRQTATDQLLCSLRPVFPSLDLDSRPEIAARMPGQNPWCDCHLPLAPGDSHGIKQGPTA